VRPLDVKGVENGNDVRNTGRKRVGATFAWLVASALTAVVGEDQAELAAQRLRETRPLRDLEWVGEAGVEEDGRARVSRVLEVRTDAIDRARCVRQALSLVLGASTYICAAGRGLPPGAESLSCSRVSIRPRCSRS
jgi:hypothetical protein